MRTLITKPVISALAREDRQSYRSLFGANFWRLTVTHCTTSPNRYIQDLISEQNRHSAYPLLDGFIWKTNAKRCRKPTRSRSHADGSWKWANLRSSSNVLIFIQFLKEYDYVKYCQIAFCMFLLLMMNYKKDGSLKNKYFNAFCREKCLKVLLVRNVGERQKWSGWTWVLNSKGFSLIWKWLSSTILSVFLYVM